MLDAALRPVPVGVTGELYFGGDCPRAATTAPPNSPPRRFVEHPWRPGARLYRTGDLGRILGNGEIVWLGRADTQVKVRGFRIEPAEVELAIMRQAERQPACAAAVVARERQGNDAFLAAFPARRARRRWISPN